jgi:membrane fusion protein (multidrug efflux system)
VAAARARLSQSALNLSYVQIPSPIDGVVAQKNVREGQYVQAGQPLFAVVPARAAYLEANFKETQLQRIKPGAPVRFTVDAYPGATFLGTVESISPGTGSVFSLLPPENASGNFTKVVQRVPVRIRIDWRRSADRALREGMSVVATVDTGA